MNRLLMIGLNHTTAPLGVRESIAFTGEQVGAFIGDLLKIDPAMEVVVVSTCNRVEIYTAAATEIAVERVAAVLAHFHGVADDELATHLYHKKGPAVVEHLFAVASSLDSMVLGETQIVGQIGRAYELSRSLSATGPLLNPLFQRATAVGREVLSTTGLTEGRVSVASVALDYAKRIFDHFNDKSILCVGTGKMTQLLLQKFAAVKPGRLMIASREQHRADAMATAAGGEGVALADLDQHLIEADVVITSTAAQQPIVTKERFSRLLKHRRYRRLFIIDLAVPRDVEPAVGELEGVFLYNIDDLQEVVSKTTDTRSGSIERAKAIVAGHVDDFIKWHRQRAIGPMIRAVEARYLNIADEELDKSAGRLNLSQQQRQQLDLCVGRMVRKMLHEPLKQLRHRPVHENHQAYAHAIEKIFGLDNARLAAEATSKEAEPASKEGHADQSSDDRRSGKHE